MRVSRDGSAEDAVALGAVVLVAVLLGGSAVVSLVLSADPRFDMSRRIGGIVLSVLCLGLSVAVQIGLSRQRWSARVPQLAIVAAAISVVLFFFFDSWTLLGMGLAVIALAFRGPRRWVVVLLIVGVCHTYLVSQTSTFDARIGIPMVNWVTAAVLYAMTRLVVVLRELRTTREHLARLQVDEERSRISRDLHDIIGRTLVAVSLRNQTAMRLIDVDVAKCREQLDQVQSSITAGQAQLRALTSGPVIIGLSSELDTARRLFDRLGIRCSVETVTVEDRAVDQALAAVVREAVTNSLKHSRPHECRITVRRESLATVLSVVNDGAGAGLDARAGAGPSGGGTPVTEVAVGTGLDDIRTRLEMLGGTLDAGAVEGQFRVIARVPHRSLTPMPDGAIGAPVGLRSAS